MKVENNPTLYRRPSTGIRSSPESNSHAKFACRLHNGLIVAMKDRVNYSFQRPKLEQQSVLNDHFNDQQVK